MIVRYVHSLPKSTVLQMDWPPRFRPTQRDTFFSCYPVREDADYRYRVGEPLVLRTPEDVIDCLNAYEGPFESQYVAHVVWLTCDPRFPATVFSTHLQWIAHREGGAWEEWGRRLTYLEKQVGRCFALPLQADLPAPRFRAGVRNRTLRVLPRPVARVEDELAAEHLCVEVDCIHSAYSVLHAASDMCICGKVQMARQGRHVP